MSIYYYYAEYGYAEYGYAECLCGVLKKNNK
jgi:hypothetical protein